MAFTYRLSRRLAQIHISVAAMFSLACSDAPQSGLTSPSDIDVSATNGTLLPGGPSVSLVASQAVSSGAGACKNEPAGFTGLTDQPFIAVPPTTPKLDALGWQVMSMAHRFSILNDATSPTRGSVIKGLFPKGAPGGAGPFRLDRPLGGTYKSIYQCFSTKISSNFTANGNSAVKFGWFITPYMGGTQDVNHYINLFPKLEIRLQSIGAVLNRNLVSTFNLSQHRGEWHTVEVLVTGNTTGKSDGIGRMWVDGNQVLNKSDVQYFYPNQTAKFTKVTWNPTYGGGKNPVPYDMDQMIDGWYVSVK